MKYEDGLAILGVSLGAALLCEAIAWLAVYRTPRYRSMKAAIARATRKVDAMKGRKAPGGGRNKKIDRFESSLKEASQHLSYSKFQLGFVMSVTLLLVFGLLSSLFEGKAVAKLPFKPFAFIQKVSHRGLPGDDPTDCAMVFLYMLCSMSIRPNVQKLLGFAPPRAAGGPSLFALPEQKTK